MNITFLMTAYTAIGFDTKYTGRFIVDGNNYTECVHGFEMTIMLPKKWATCGRVLSAIN